MTSSASFSLVGTLVVVIAATVVAADPTRPGHDALIALTPDGIVRPCGFNAAGHCAVHRLVCPRRLPWLE